MIIGITGSFCAGKGAVVNYLSTRGFKQYSARQFITEEIERRKMPINRDSMIVVANDLRTAHSPTFIVDSLYQRAQEVGGDAIIESLRAVAEVKRIKELGGVVFGIDAIPTIRYGRATSRGSTTDSVSYEKFLEQEKIESNTIDPNKQNIFGALEESDFVIKNNGTLEELHAQIDVILEQIKK